MNRLDRLAEAIMWREGWKPGTRAYRNCNPGNLRWSKFECSHEDDPKYGRYSIFPTFATGWDALVFDLKSKCFGRTVGWFDRDGDGVKDDGEGLGPTSTLLELIHVYAPHGDSNNPSAYLLDVCERAGLSPSDKLSSFVNE